MPPRFGSLRVSNLVCSCRHRLARPDAPLILRSPAASRRHNSSNDKQPPTKGSQKAPGLDQEHLPHVSEEAATTSKIMGGEGPDLEQGTPVQEIMQRDKDAREKAPEVLKEQIKAQAPQGSRKFSTSARRKAETMLSPASLMETALKSGAGHIFPLPELPLPKFSHMKHREDDVVDQVTKLMMKDGKLSQAQRNVSRILNHLRTMPSPALNTSKPILPSPPASQLPLDPVAYLTLAIDSVAPLLRMRYIKGAAGGGAALAVPAPLRMRQRRRTAIMWILEAAAKRRWRGSGKGGFAHRMAEEIIAILEGRSGVWDRRAAAHKLGTAARSNVKLNRR